MVVSVSWALILMFGIILPRLINHVFVQSNSEVTKKQQQQKTLLCLYLYLLIQMPRINIFSKKSFEFTFCHAELISFSQVHYISILVSNGESQ